MEAFGLRRTQSLWGVSGYQERSRATPDPNRWDRKSVLQLVQQYVLHETFFHVSASVLFRNNSFAFAILLLKSLKCQLSSASFEALENFLDF